MKRSVVWRMFAILFAAALFVVGLQTTASAAPSGSVATVVDPIEPPEPPPPCPERIEFNKDISLEIKTPVKVERRAGAGTYLVIFTLQDAHAFNPPDPNGCTGTDGVVSKLGSSINVSDGPTILQTQQTAVKELTPTDPTQPMVYHFKLKYQKDFNLTGLVNPKRDANWCLVILVLNNGQTDLRPPQHCT